MRFDSLPSLDVLLSCGYQRDTEEKLTAGDRRVAERVEALAREGARRADLALRWQPEEGSSHQVGRIGGEGEPRWRADDVKSVELDGDVELARLSRPPLEQV